MINHTLDLPFGKNQILKQYQKISQIGQLQSLITHSKNDQQFFEQYSQEKFKNFISKVELKKQQNTQKLQTLLEQSRKQQGIINYELPNLIKQQIFSFADQINFFNSELISNRSNNLNETENNFSKTLMGLISNKSNFCLKDFLYKVEKQLKRLNSLFENIQTENTFIYGKKPIEFELLSDQQIDNLNSQVQHLIRLEADRSYESQILESQFFKQIKKILESKLNFIDSKIKSSNGSFNLMFWISKVRLEYIQMIEQQEKFELFCQLDTQEIDIIFQLVKKKQQIRDSMEKSLTKQVLNKYKFNKFKKGNLERILNQFPIFDIISINQQNILNELQLVKSTYNDEHKRIFITKNGLNQFEITLNEQQYQGQKRYTETDCMSNMILEKDKKYIIRVKFKTKDQLEYFLIGLMQQKNFNFQQGNSHGLTTLFKIKINKLQIDSNNFTNYLKGSQKELPVESIIEFRVWLNGSIFQIINYPQNDFVVSLQNEKLENLQKLENLSFFLTLKNSQIYVITEACLVEEYDD